MIQLAGSNAVDPDVEIMAVRSAIAEASRRRTFGSRDWIGQGIRRIPEIEGLFVLTGDKAAIIKTESDGGVVSKEVSVPLIANKLIQFDSSSEWVELDKLLKCAQGIEPTYTKKLLKQLLKYLDCWKFSNEYDQQILAAMILVTPLQGALSFRPHIWVTGPTNCGKTALFTLLEGLWPFAEAVGNETTEAGIRQQIQHSCLPILLDEYEAWRGRAATVKLLRTSTRGGEILKGTPSGKVLRFGLRHIAWIASVDTGLRRAVDRNRFIVVELANPDRIKIPNRDTLRPFGVKLIGAALALTDRICNLFEVLSGCEEVRKFGRLAECFALPSAVEAAFTGLSLEQAQQQLVKLLEAQRETLMQQNEPDHEDLLREILSSKIRAEVFDEYGPQNRIENRSRDISVGELIQRDTHHQELAVVGIKVVDDGVFFVPPIVQRHLLKGTDWAFNNIGDILARAPGAMRTRLRVAGVNPRGILLPREVLDPKNDDAS